MISTTLVLLTSNYSGFTNISFLLSFSTLTSQSGLLLKLSAFSILLPGTCFNVKLNLDRYKTHLACCQGHVEWKRSGPEWSRITPEWKEVDNKVGEQPWPQLVYCTLICCHVYGCIFQEAGIVVRSAGVEMNIKDVNDFIYELRN